MPGTPERRSHADHRHGTVELCAALNTASGTVIGKLSARQRAVEVRDFLAEIDRPVESGLRIRVGCDDLAAHTVPAVHRWLVEHPRFALHCTPTYASWLNQVQ